MNFDTVLCLNRWLKDADVGLRRHILAKVCVPIHYALAKRDLGYITGAIIMVGFELENNTGGDIKPDPIRDQEFKDEHARLRKLIEYYKRFL